MVHGFAKTPRYVLKDGSRITRPIVSPSSSDAKHTVIFAFSDKPEYDTFLRASLDALTPYPLVKGYLRNQLILDDEWLHLLVLDASGPQQEVLDATTFKDVLEAFQTDSNSVNVTYQLILDVASKGYRIEKLKNATTEKVVS